MRRYERRNIACNTIGEGFWGLGWSLAAPLTVMPILIRRLGGGAFEIGLLAAMISAGSLLPQFLGSLLIQSGRGRKQFLISYHLYAITPPWLLMGISMLLLSEARPSAARLSLIALISLSVFCIGLIIPIWLDWLAGIFRKAIRGLAFGLSSSASAIGGALAALSAAYVTGTLAFPLNYAALFFAASVLFVLSMVVFSFVRVSGGVRPPTLSRRDVFGRFRSSLSSGNFRRYLAARGLVAIGAAATSFYAVHYLSDQGGAVPSQAVIGIGALIWISQAFFSTVIGRLGDRFGHRAGVIVGVSAQALSIMMVMFLPGVVSCGAAFVLTGVGFAGAAVSHQNFLFETCPHDSRTAHITVANLVLAPVMTVAPLVAGRTMERFGTYPVFGMCLAATALGLVWVAGFVKNPKEPSPAEAGEEEATGAET